MRTCVWFPNIHVKSWAQLHVLPALGGRDWWIPTDCWPASLTALGNLLFSERQKTRWPVTAEDTQRPTLASPCVHTGTPIHTFTCRHHTHTCAHNYIYTWACMLDVCMCSLYFYSYLLLDKGCIIYITLHALSKVVVFLGNMSWQTTDDMLQWFSFQLCSIPLRCPQFTACLLLMPG